MPNPYVNKVVANGVTKLDLSADTVDAAHLLSGYTAHDRTGAAITGTATAGSGGSVSQDANGYIVLPPTSSGGGGGDSWSWMGKNPTKVLTFPAEHAKFSDTDFANWTWTTSQTNLRAAQNYDAVTGCDKSLYDYVQVLQFYAHYEYESGWTVVSALTDWAFSGSYFVSSSYANNVASVENETVNYYKMATSTSDYRSYYINANGTKATSASASGLYISSMNSPSASGTFPTYSITFKKPILYAVGSSTSFSQTAFSHLDMDNSYYDLKSELWRVDAGTTPASVCTFNVVHMLNNGL